jgi:helicase
MEIASLPLPESLIQIYREKGIIDLYPPQETCIESGLLNGRNLLVSIPTASGKTLVAEMAMHHHVARGGKCLYIVPLKALASEKYEEFGNKGARIGISTGDFDRRDEQLGRNDIIVATSEKVDSLLRNSTPWLGEITLLVVDEVHLIDSPDRGTTLEMVITKMRYKNPGMQIIALSATIGNPERLAGWMDAEVITSRWRPVELREGVFYRGTIYFDGSERPVHEISKYDDLNLCLDTIAEGGQCLIFVSSRRNAESFAKRAASAVKQKSPALLSYSQQLRSLADTETDLTLADCVAQGAAFHHAGLRREQRRIIEDGFRTGHIKCIASTPTLAAGLNLPARRVIIRDYLRFHSGEGMTPIPIREYHQMAGRAGRPQLDPYGEAVLIAKERDSISELSEYYINSPPEDVQSRASGEWALGSHILSLIATQFVMSRSDLLAFMDRTFYCYQKQDRHLLEAGIESILEFLTRSEMVAETGTRLYATEFGSLVSQLYIDPRSAETIATALISREQISDIGIFQLLCATPDMPKLYVRKKDLGYLERFVCEHDNELWVEFPSFADEGLESFYETIKTAMLLSNWTEEVPDAQICERYGVGPGDIYMVVEGVDWLMHAGTQLARMFATAHVPAMRDLERRIRHGVRRELLPLVSLRGIGRVRARRLFNNGIRDREAIKAAGREKITAILGRGITEQVFSQLDSEGDADDDSQTTLGSFRRSV